MDLSNFGVGEKKEEKKPEAIDDVNLDFDVDSFKEGLSVEETEYYLPWFLKYKAESADDLIMTKELKKVFDFIEGFKQGKGLLLVGAAGSGKTTTVTLLAEYYGYELYEMNASDTRNKKSIQESLTDVIKQRSLFGTSKLILIDEVDGVAGNEDRGGVAEISKLVKESPFPIIFTANDKESEKLKPLKKVATFIDFENHTYELLEKLAHHILSKEGIEYDETNLQEFIKQRNTTDVRGFINDLQASVMYGRLVPNDAMELREYKQKVEQLLQTIYFSSPEQAFTTNIQAEVQPDDLFLWLEENIHSHEASPKARSQQFQEVAKADVFRGRIRKWQYWRYLAYISFYLTYGISAAREEPKPGPFKRNQRLLKKWMNNNKFKSLQPRTRAQKQKGEKLTFIEELARYYKTSIHHCRTENLFYFAWQFQQDHQFREAMKQQFNIDETTEQLLLQL